jgi:hypothetical protein
MSDTSTILVLSAADLAQAALFGAGLYSTMELFFMIGYTFKRWSGLCFWSILLTTFGQALQIISAILQCYHPDTAAELTIGVPGYLMYVLFEFLALYSRLHILRASKRLLRWTLIIVFAELIIIEIPYMIMMIDIGLHPESPILPTYPIWIHLEGVVYLCMDLGLSITYVVHIVDSWSFNEGLQQRKVFRHLIFMAVCNVLIDLVYVVVTYKLDSDWLAAVNVSDSYDIILHLLTFFSHLYSQSKYKSDL